MKNKELKVSMDLYPTQLYCNKRTLQTGICQLLYTNGPLVKLGSLQDWNLEGGWSTASIHPTHSKV